MKIALSNFYRLRLVPGNPVCLSLLLASNIFLSGNESLPSTALLTMVVKALFNSLIGGNTAWRISAIISNIK